MDCGGRAQRRHRFPRPGLVPKAAWRCASRRTPKSVAAASAAPGSSVFIRGFPLHSHGLGWLGCGLYHACTSHVPRMYLACTWLSPPNPLPSIWLSPGLYLPCITHVPGFGRLCTAFLHSSFCLLHSSRGGLGPNVIYGAYPVCIRRVSGVSPMTLACATGDPAERLKRDEPGNTPNTRKANRQEVSFPRISRIPRSIPPASDCGFTALRLCVG